MQEPTSLKVVGVEGGVPEPEGEADGPPRNLAEADATAPFHGQRDAIAAYGHAVRKSKTSHGLAGGIAQFGAQLSARRPQIDPQLVALKHHRLADHFAAICSSINAHVSVPTPGGAGDSSLAQKSVVVIKRAVELVDQVIAVINRVVLPKFIAYTERLLREDEPVVAVLFL